MNELYETFGMLRFLACLMVLDAVGFVVYCGYEIAKTKKEK
jgi:hypothetical protein